jgi:hypothetical protein
MEPIHWPRLAVGSGLQWSALHLDRIQHPMIHGRPISRSNR